MIKVGKLEYTARYFHGSNFIPPGWYSCRLLDGEVLDFTATRFSDKESAEAHLKEKATFDASFV